MTRAKSSAVPAADHKEGKGAEAKQVSLSPAEFLVEMKGFLKEGKPPSQKEVAPFVSAMLKDDELHDKFADAYVSCLDGARTDVEKAAINARAQLIIQNMAAKGRFYIKTYNTGASYHGGTASPESLQVEYGALRNLYRIDPIHTAKPIVLFRGPDGKPASYAMELVQGEALKGGVFYPLSLDKRLEIAQQIVDYIKDIHASEFYHGDPSKSNIIYDKRERTVKFIDPYPRSGDLSSDHNPFGTPLEENQRNDKRMAMDIVIELITRNNQTNERDVAAFREFVERNELRDWPSTWGFEQYLEEF